MSTDKEKTDREYVNKLINTDITELRMEVVPDVDKQQENENNMAYRMKKHADSDVDLKKHVSFTHLAIINRLLAAQSEANRVIGSEKHQERFINSFETLVPRVVATYPYENDNHNITGCSGIAAHDHDYITKINNIYINYIKSPEFEEYKNTKEYINLKNNGKKFNINKFIEETNIDVHLEMPGMRKFVNKYYEILQGKLGYHYKYGNVNYTKYWTGTIEDVMIRLYTFIKDKFDVVGIVSSEENDYSDGELSAQSKFIKHMSYFLNKEKLPVYCSMEDYERSEEMINFSNKMPGIYSFLTISPCRTGQTTKTPYIYIGGKKTSRRQKRKSKRKSTKRRTKRKLRRKNTKK